MTREEELAAEWTRLRPRLVSVAYAVLGSRTEAEDIVADCWLSLVTADAREPVRDLYAWGTIAVARRAVDALRSARRQREAYIGPWLPEPFVEPVPASDPADRVTLDERVSFALMVALEALSPAERTAWVLHDLFGLPFRDVASVVGRTTAAVRQLAVRARAHIAAGASRIEVDPGERRRVADAFLTAAAGGDLATLVSVLDPDVVLVSDGGGQVRAARRPVVGANNVARLFLGLARRSPPGAVLRPIPVNGSPGFILTQDDATLLVAALTVVRGRISRIDLVLAPDKLPQ